MSEAANYLFKAEEELRRLVTDMQMGRVNNEGFLARVNSILNTMARGSEEIAGMPFTDDILRALEVSDRILKRLVYEIENTPRDIREERGRIVIDSAVENWINELDEVIKELTGSGCKYGVGETLNSRVNDVAACVHRIAEYVQENIGKPTVIGKCTISPSATERAKKLCELWDKYTERMREWGRYSAGDYDALKGWVIDDKAYFRVGSAAGHRTFVDLSKGVLNYYDVDRDVNEAMERVWEEFLGASCEVRDDGVDCTFKPPTTDDEIKRIAATIAQPTSLDFRLGNPSQYYDVEEIIEKYMPDLKKEIERIVEEAFREAGL